MMDLYCYTVTYRDPDGHKVSLCVMADNVTHAIVTARDGVQSIYDHPSRIISVIRGC